MKKKFTSQSAFFNPRVLIGLCIVLVGVVLALAQIGVFSAAAQGILQAMTKGKIITQSQDPLVPVGFDCSTIHEKGIDKQENFRAGAIIIACWATPLLCTTGQPGLGSLSILTWRAAVRASADTSPPLPRTRIVGPISAFSTRAVLTESLA